MRKLFYGFLLMFLSFDLSVNGHTLDVLPDFVGYFLLIRGMKEMEAESGLFQNARPFAVGMMVYTAVLWVGNLLAVTGEGWLTELLNLIAMIVELYIAWLLIRAVRETEEARGADLSSGRLFGCWKGLVAVQAAAKLLALMINLANVSVLISLIAVLAVIALVLNVLYLIAWWKATRAYEALPPKTAGPEFY